MNADNDTFRTTAPSPPRSILVPLAILATHQAALGPCGDGERYEKSSEDESTD